jgi:hypothetical protein
MKKIVYKESKTLLAVRRIKEEFARKAEKDPDFYLRMNGLGAKLLASSRKKAKKSA